MVVGLLDNKSSCSNRFILAYPKSENDARLQATLDSKNPTGKPVGVVSLSHYYMPFYDGSFRGVIHLHGHTHNSKESQTEESFKQYLRNIGYNMCAINVGCMHWHYEPVTLDEILGKMGE